MNKFKGKYPFITEEQVYYDSMQRREEEALNRFDLWVKKNKAGYHYNDVHNSIIEYFKKLSKDDLLRRSFAEESSKTESHL